MITPRAIDVVLLNEAHEPLITWYVVGAWPTKWAVADLNAANNSYSVETLQFAYQHFTVNRN
jgi:phage tail-like protein